MEQRNEQLLYAAKLLLSYAGGQLQRTNLNKALFYFDLMWLQDKGQTFTGAEYAALPQGPVVNNYAKILIEPLLADHAVTEEKIQWAPGKFSLPLHLVIEPSQPDEHLEVIARRAAELVAGRKAIDISEASHENLGWKLAIQKGSGTQINMLLALDQLCEPDPWLDEPLTEAERLQTAEAMRQETTPL